MKKFIILNNQCLILYSMALIVVFSRLGILSHNFYNNDVVELIYSMLFTKILLIN